jgi:NAD(P)-dependent dehydrogenase (short-subunit alcohol dehydrogenase family)
VPTPTRHYDRLAGKVALVTGAGSQGNGIGIGRAIASVFASEGARVCLVDREPARATETLGMIESIGGIAFVYAADVTLEDDCQSAVEAVTSRFGRLDVLVNNVGLGAGGGKLDQLPPELFDTIFQVNFRSAYLMSRSALPHLVKYHGNVVNIVSTAGLRAHGAAAYGPSKAALLQFTHEIAVTYGRDGVRANSIAPGHLFTPLVEQHLDAGGRERRRRIAPLGAEGDAWDVALAAVFLASDEARFITAACLPVDGGVTQVAALTAHELWMRDMS